jgi:hypothetical protein
VIVLPALAIAESSTGDVVSGTTVSVAASLRRPPRNY